MAGGNDAGGTAADDKPSTLIAARYVDVCSSTDQISNEAMCLY